MKCDIFLFLFCLVFLNIIQSFYAASIVGTKLNDLVWNTMVCTSNVDDLIWNAMICTSEKDCKATFDALKFFRKYTDFFDYIFYFMKWNHPARIRLIEMLDLLQALRKASYMDDKTELKQLRQYYRQFFIFETIEYFHDKLIICTYLTGEWSVC